MATARPSSASPQRAASCRSAAAPPVAAPTLSQLAATNNVIVAVSKDPSAIYIYHVDSVRKNQTIAVQGKPLSVAFGPDKGQFVVGFNTGLLLRLASAPSRTTGTVEIYKFRSELSSWKLRQAGKGGACRGAV